MKRILVCGETLCLLLYHSNHSSIAKFDQLGKRYGELLSLGSAELLQSGSRDTSVFVGVAERLTLKQMFPRHRIHRIIRFPQYLSKTLYGESKKRRLNLSSF